MFHWTRRKYFWQPCQKLSWKDTGFSCQNPKKTKNQLFNSFFWRFFLCTLRLLFQHTRLIFLPKSEKKLIESPKRDDNSEYYINRFFLRTLLRTREMHFINLPIFFAKIWSLSLRDQKRSENYSSLQKSLKTFRCSRRLQFWEISQKIHAKSWLIRSTTKNLEQNFFIPKKRPKKVPLNTLNGILTILRVFFV